MMKTGRRWLVGAALLFGGATSVSAQPRAPGMTPALDSIIRDAATASGFMGTVLVANRSRILYQRQTGMANATWSIPNAATTRFRVASVTKQVTALLIMQYVQSGQLRLDGSIADYLPWFAADTARRITLEQLLTHMSGLRDLDDVPGYYVSDDSTLRTHSDVVRRYLMAAPEWTPGSRFRYNNADYVILGAILEELSGMSFDALLETRILAPLGMKNTGMVHERTIIPRLAEGYDTNTSGTLERQDEPVERYLASGALYSTADDLLRFYRAVDSHRLLSASSTERMFRPNGYGGALGSWQYDWQDAPDSLRPDRPRATARVIERQGWIGAYRGLSVMIPSRGLYVIVIANGGHADLSTLSRGTGIASRIIAAVTTHAPSR